MIKFKSIYILLSCSALLFFSSNANAELSAQSLMDKVYGGFSAKNNCWVIMNGDNDQRYCMRIDRVDKIKAISGQRMYVLAVSEPIDENGEQEIGAHVTSGLVGAFVVEERNGAAEIVCGESKLSIGASGLAPRKWNFVSLGPSDYWGWQNITGDCHQGTCGTRYSILAPFGKKIRDLAGIAASFDNSGNCGDNRCSARSSVITSTLEIDSTQVREKVFPLVITVSGKKDGKKIQQKSWSMPLDFKKWSYVEPKEWPLKDVEF